MWFALVLVGCPKPEPVVALPDLAERREATETLHGVAVPDPYRWLEEGDAADVVAWVEGRNTDYTTFTDALPDRPLLFDRLQSWMRYDDETVRTPCLVGTRETWKTRRADQDEWVIHVAEGPQDPGRVVLDPNTWDVVDTLASFAPTPDCSLAVYGRARAGNEDPVLAVLDLATGETLSDTVRGWRQGGVRWRHDRAGFWYASRPLASERPNGDHYYFQRIWWHTLGTPAEQDVLVLHDEETKELWHTVSVSEDGRWLLRGQGLFQRNRLWLEDLQGEGGVVPVTTELDAEYDATVVGDALVIVTDLGAPRRRVMVTDLATPGREHWRELIPESDDVLRDVRAIGGRLYAVYQHDVATRLAVFETDGTPRGDVELPTFGAATVDGWYGRPEVRVAFESFGHLPQVYTLVPETGALELKQASAVPVPPELLADIVVDQVWFTSPDGTRVPMFVVHRRGVTEPGPTLLTGYGGFDISLVPKFSTLYALWLERGGAVAIPNLRGGGEFGREWHEAGMRERKQNVFDDFLAAAEWLVSEGWTTPAQLAISGGSNGGLLVSAAVVQRPDLFGAVLCSVPLTDMVRYHRFGLANIWAEEYGSAEDPDLFPVLLGYSPYHAVREGTDYPAILVVGSSNDARTDPAHARKFAAAVEWGDVDHGTRQPILLAVQGESGHAGGVTIDARADQLARQHAFLMAQVGLRPRPLD